MLNTASGGIYLYVYTTNFLTLNFKVAAMVNVFPIAKVLYKDRLLLTGIDNQGNNFLHKIIIKFLHIGMQTYEARGT